MGSEMCIRDRKEFAKNVNGLVAAFQEAGNPFLEKTNDLIAMDSKNIANETAVENLWKISDAGKDQFKEFLNCLLKEKKTSIYAVIKNNKFLIFDHRNQKYPHCRSRHDKNEVKVLLLFFKPVDCSIITIK